MAFHDYVSNDVATAAYLAREDGDYDVPSHDEVCPGYECCPPETDEECEEYALLAYVDQRIKEEEDPWV
jgi:hypothetical protein